jgi:tRNA G18 (ribose-2'-O)-methylase SpoU
MSEHPTGWHGTWVSSAADPRLAAYVSLRDAALRRSLEAAEGLFIAEGEKVIRRAAAAGLTPRSFLMAPRWQASLGDVVAGHPEADCLLADEETVERVSGFHVHRGALAAFERPRLPTAEDLVVDARRIVVLEDVNDHANVGSVFRNAAAFGFDAVALSPRCADPLYRRSIKVSMGAVFAIPFGRTSDWRAFPELLGGLDIEVVALTPERDAADIREVAHGIDRRVALLLGSEGHGLSARWLASATTRARIPMVPGVDSLNVAAASAVACYLLGDTSDADAVPNRTSAPTGAQAASSEPTLTDDSGRRKADAHAGHIASTAASSPATGSSSSPPREAGSQPAGRSGIRVTSAPQVEQ